MAVVKPALKKPVVTRGNAPGNANPNTVLVVFLVLFVLTSIGLGTWAYVTQGAQKDLETVAVREKKSATAMEKKAEFLAFMTRELKVAVGQTLEGDEQISWDISRQDILKEGGKYQDEALRPVFLALMMDMRKDLATKDLPGFDDNTKKYAPSYKERLAAMADEVKKARGEASAQIGAATGAKDQLAKFNKTLDKAQKDALDLIRQGNDEALKAARAKYKQMEDQLRLNDELTAKNKELLDTSSEQKEALELNIRVLKERLEKALTTKEAPAVANPKPAEGGAAETHALILDISKGKPLWDRPVGQIVRVIEGKQVVINLGSEDNVKPPLTFNVFLSPHGIPDREMKGTIEVVRTINGKTSLCNITSQTNKDFPIKEDDGLYNPVFGAHVAIAGQVNWFAAGGERGESPDEQVRSLNQFMQLLKNQGVIVDAYVDLSNGTIKGTINSRTRYLIRGDNLFMRAPPKGEPKEEKKDDKEAVKDKDVEKDKEKDADKEKDKDADKEKDKDADKEKEKEPEKKDKDAGDPKPMPMGDAPGEGPLGAMNLKRIQLANESIKILVRQSVENGTFIISTTNFAVVAGYRRLVTTVNPAEVAFRPSLPSANVIPGSAPRPAAKLYGGQKTCPVMMGNALGSTGPAVAVTVMGRTIYVCCEACVATVQGDPETYLKKVDAEIGK